MENKEVIESTENRKISFFKKLKEVMKRPIFYVFALQVIASIFLIFTVIKIGVLSLKFLIPIILVIVLINFLVIFFFKKSRKKKVKTAISLLSGIFSICCLIISVILMQMYSSIDDMFKNNSYINYSVRVLKTSQYKVIDDIDQKIVGYYIDDKYSEAAKKIVDKEVYVEYVGYSSINELKYALMTSEVDAVLVMDSYLDLDEESSTDLDTEITDTDSNQDKILSEIDNFESKSKVLYSFKIKVDNSKKTKKIDLEKGSFVVYVSGQDSFSDSVSETSRSDVNLLMVVNVKSKEILLLSVPRDYYVEIADKGAMDKLTHISLYGSETASKSLGNLLDTPVDYYVKFNFTTFMKAVEYMLPLDVYSDYDFTTSVYDQTIGDSFTFSKGYNHITDGKMALQFVRARKNFSEGDRQRGINQSRFLRAVINKASTPSVLLKYNKILKALKGTFLTNISDQSIIEIIRYVIDNNGSFNISSISLDGSDASRPTYSSGSQALYVMIPDSSTIKRAKEQIKIVLDGGKPNIEQDASELDDVKNTHTVTKGNGKVYSDTGRNNNSNINNEVTSSDVEKTPIIDNKEEDIDNKNNENGDGDSSSDLEESKNPRPTVSPSPSDDFSSPSEDVPNINS